MSDVFIAYDGGSFFKTYLYTYNGNLYNLIPAKPSFPNPTVISMYKSTNGGTTWTALASTISAQYLANVSGPVCLIGTKLYIYYMVSGTFEVGLAYFDFTTDAFTTLTVTGAGTAFDSPFMVGSVATQLYLTDNASGGKVQVGQYVSDAYSNIGVISASGTYANVYPELLFLGSSGVLHIFYRAQLTDLSSSGADLGYANYSGSTLSAGTIVYTGFNDQYTTFGVGSTGAPVQIGSNIYFSFYDPINHEVKLMAFTDSATPTFTVSVIDPSFTITPPSFAPTGILTNVLAYFGATLYCFYTNTNEAGTGDGNLYYRSSTNNGSSWSARKTALTHLDPIQGTAFAIWMPEVMQYVGTPGTPSTIEVSYLQVLNDSSSQYGEGRFAFGVPLVTESAKNYVLS